MDLDYNEVPEWRYEMRREMQEILPNLYLGPYSVAKSLPTLTQNQITHIVCLRSVDEAFFMRPYFPEALKYLLIEVSDDTLQNLIRQFPTVKSFIDQAISEGGRVLIHCESGISRAPAFVVAYVMETMGLSYQIAFNYVQSKRFCINPNDNFKNQLKAYESIYRARCAPIQRAGEQGIRRARDSSPSTDDKKRAKVFVDL